MATLNSSASPPPPGPTASPPPGPSVPTPPAPVERKKRGPKPWATAEQWSFLEGGVPEYRGAQSVKGKNAAIATFIKDFMPKFWTRFPLEGDRTKDGDIKRVKEWFQNHGSAKKVETAAHLADMFAKPRTRALKAEEVYSCQYYAECIKPLVDQRKIGISTRGEVLKIIKETTKEVFEAESEEVQNQVLELTKEQVPLSVTENGIGPITLEMFAAALAAAPDQIRTFMDALSKATGCAVMILLGGPDPWENGKISTHGYISNLSIASVAEAESSFHAGEDEHGRNFGQAFPNFKDTYLAPFTRFLRQVYHTGRGLSQSVKDGETGKQTPDEWKNMENGKQDNVVDKEKRDADDNADVPAGKEPADLPPSLSPSPPVLLPLPKPPVPSAEPEDQSLSKPHKGDDSHQASEGEKNEGEKRADSFEMLEEGLSDKEPSEQLASPTAASVWMELQRTQPTTKPHKRQITQIDDGLTATRTKRVHSGPAPKEILMLAEHAELEGGSITAKGPKHRAKKT
ncbi:uncharacterized protein ARMOST_02914 [Armillaria ostoyae]|uniref:Uncharacterized protein n=1 Tax=Armillaria ostoyae TaxID=47428 RepID=A0A284QT07_ARMOS|nr:uncharacterized protein ARMOST_02914 [Armillaria ostoyae]